jgi:pimeloyl-ACP methyl ester carboxylesterase
MRFSIFLVSLLLLVAPAAAQTDFYAAPPVPGGPGTLIAQEPVSGAPEGAQAYRVLYNSIGLHGEPIAVSGMVIVPKGPAPEGGRPIVAWAHPTSGVVPKCAPSLKHLVFFLQIQGLRAMLEQGFIVAATDYAGLGTPGTHPYLVGTSEARAVIDSVRAARNLPGAGAGNRFAVWGHSQGGHAALFTGLIAKDYAPELSLVGVAAAAPATDLKTEVEADIDTTSGRSLAALAFYSWEHVFNVPVDTVVLPQAMPTVDVLADVCIENLTDLIERGVRQRPLKQAFLADPNFAEEAPWRGMLADNTPGALPPSIPVFIIEGTTDAVVLPEVTNAYFGSLCRGGSSVRMVWLPDVPHTLAGFKGKDQAVAWMADRFAGVTPPNDCPR